MHTGFPKRTLLKVPQHWKFCWVLEYHEREREKDLDVRYLMRLLKFLHALSYSWTTTLENPTSTAASPFAFSLFWQTEFLNCPVIDAIPH
ncbi:hypothetical protein CDAR_516151 [Caerostris darwini]|uniref:Uncharacterized protein n=1 Tax=Caerostris darwini TaxID=1538125 RepID=A0AAV4W6C0_9ARAC|nr:hypothetical protein CDAR_516151 [Caerostris darwini]